MNYLFVCELFVLPTPMNADTVISPEKEKKKQETAVTLKSLDKKVTGST